MSLPKREAYLALRPEALVRRLVSASGVSVD